MAPRIKSETANELALKKFVDLQERMGEPRLGLLMMIARIQLAIKVKEVTPSTGAFETLSHIYEADVSNRLNLNEWNRTAARLPMALPSVLIPLWVFEALAKG